MECSTCNWRLFDLLPGREPILTRIKLARSFRQRFPKERPEREPNETSLQRQRIPSRLEKMSEGQSTYKLICLDARGSAEQIRYIFAYADIEYIEETIPKESGPLVQKSVPYGILPLVEIDGKPIVQSNAVSRYLARKHNLTGRDEWEAMLCDVLVDTLEDLKRIIFQYRTEKDQFKKEEKKAKLLKETIPFYLKQFEQTIGENGGYAVGSTTTWADFVFAVALENFENIFGTTALGNYPGLRALKNRVHEIPAIANFLANRPRTKF
ncbi:glutathione S-transferase isoform X2 [Ptiloglossa arizonensis]|uniref:glutathione S-transferase isoform X2 n=1 Tax=Ptiloglossa arizonensis TaxID=3350558 RepID=UPI003F9F642C